MGGLNEDVTCIYIHTYKHTYKHTYNDIYVHVYTLTHLLTHHTHAHTHTQAGHRHLDASRCKRGEWEASEGVPSGGPGVGGKQLGEMEDVGGKKVADGKEGKDVGVVGSRTLALDPKIVKVCVLYARLGCLV